ncbi:MAG: hypothetical protein JW927_22970 [Deltaproteobacteria bacterium]|nr:hypothetical protein [Deltaproteobacteria bacterium]
MLKKTVPALFFTIVLIFFSSISCVSVSTKCDRECLKGFVTSYLDALVAQKPDLLPLSPKVKFTEDCKEIKVGQGLWQSKIKLTDYRRDILDVKQGVAVSFLVIEEKELPVLFVFRLKIEDQKISEIESTVVRGKEEGMLFTPENLKTVSKGMTYVPKKEQLVDREKAIKMADTYPEGLKVGSFVKVDSPMADNAYRFENGQLMAGPECTFFKGCDNMKKQFIPTLAGIKYRTIAVDEEMGVVAVRMNFGPGSLFRGDGELDVWHSFKIYDNLIHVAEAYCEIVPKDTPFGW